MKRSGSRKQSINQASKQWINESSMKRRSDAMQSIKQARKQSRKQASTEVVKQSSNHASKQRNTAADEAGLCLKWTALMDWVFAWDDTEMTTRFFILFMFHVLFIYNFRRRFGFGIFRFYDNPTHSHRESVYYDNRKQKNFFSRLHQSTPVLLLVTHWQSSLQRNYEFDRWEAMLFNVCSLFCRQAHAFDQ